MKIPFRGEKEGVKGIGAQEKTSLLIVVILIAIEAPILIIDYLIQQALLTEEIGLLFTVVILVCEVAAIYGFNAHAQIEASKTLSFPASLWRFSPTEKTLIDLFVPKEGIRFVGKFTKSGIDTLMENLKKQVEKGKPKNPSNPSDIENPVFVYVIPNVGALGYTHPQKGELLFNRFLWILPDNFEETFMFTPGGETWWGSFPVTHPKSEGVVLHVVDWHDHMGEIMPICVVADSSRHYEQSLGMCKLSHPDYRSVVASRLSVLRQDNIELTDLVHNLDDHLKAKVKESYSTDKLINMRLADIQRRHGNIMRATIPWKYRLINLKTLAVVAVIITIVAIIWWSL